MLKNCWVLLAVAVLSDALCGVARAARTVLLPASPFVVTIWERRDDPLADSLPQSSIFSIVQGRGGYLWLGTLNGLVRFDGLRFTTFDESNTPGLNSSPIMHLFEDGHGNLWIGPEKGDLVVLGPDGVVRPVQRPPETENRRLISMCETADGAVWMLWDSGLDLNNRMVSCWVSNTVTLVTRGKHIAADSGRLLIARDDSGVYRAADGPPGGRAFVQAVPVGRSVDFLLGSRDGGFWLLADGRIEKWKGGQREKQFGTYPWPAEAPVYTACEDQDGNLIVGTYGDGVYWFDANGEVRHLSRELSHSYILSVAVDREGNLWIGTNGGGLHRVKRRQFGVLPASEGFVVQSVCEDPAGNLWIGYNGESRVDRHRPNTTEELRLVHDARAPNCAIKSVFADDDGRVWTGLWLAGDFSLPKLLTRDPSADRFEALSPEEAVHFDVSVIYQDRSRRLWIGTAGGLGLKTESGWRWFVEEHGLPSRDIRGLADDAAGNLWIVTGNGLARWDGTNFISFHKKDGLPSDDLSSIYVDREGVVWVGTRGSGLARYENGMWTRYTTSDGLSGNSIGYLFEDDTGHLWMGSNAGLMRVPKVSFVELAAGRSKRLACRSYIESDGLPTRECTQGSQPAACRTRDGRLWFPTTRGLVVVDPASLRTSQYHVPVKIESILVAGREVLTNRLRPELPARLVIPPGRDQLEIRYTSLNLGAAQQSRFRIRMDADEEWNEVGDLRVASYTRLPPGEYTFQVQAANEDGVWNPVAATLAITIQPAFWQTTWFRVAAIGVLLLITVGLVYHFSTQKFQRELAILKQQEELERERARIARDLHDQLGANLMQVALLGEIVEADKHLPDEVESHAKQISQTARETTRALDEIVWAVNPSNDTLDGLMTYICKYAQEYFELAGVRYRLDVPTALPKFAIPPEVRHNVFLATKEAVNNVVKHAQATEAWLRLKLDSDCFTIEVQDNGRGVKDLAGKADRSGLRNMRKRLEDVRGTFSIEPPPDGTGTLVRLTVPINRRT
ncbi:MAG TPA: hypothetical protein GYA07_10565 [Verrucomicrobia bacterium]|nr:hypothetical protein [Verrucomicrobiota bacterium]HOP97832.1 two-component regulator propeller domain-containing protein [Verrucomicrobiota bacterium]